MNQKLNDDKQKVTETIALRRWIDSSWTLWWHKTNDDQRLREFLNKNGVILPECSPTDNTNYCEAFFASPPNRSFEEARQLFESYDGESK